MAQNHLPSPGDRIELVRMGDDPFPIEPGTRGTVTSVHEGGFLPASIGVDWDNGRSLSLVADADVWRVIP